MQRGPKPSLEDMAGDTSSGAREIKEKAVGYLLAVLENLHTGPLPSKTATADYTLEETKTAILKALKDLLEAQPSMASLFNLANGLLLHLEETGVWNGGHQDLINEAVGWLENLKEEDCRRLESLLDNASTLYKEGAVYLIHSWSSTTLGLLESWADQGKRFTVVATESRPLMEGRRTASVLAARGVPVTYIPDAAAPTAVETADAAILGADTIAIEGVVNKTGSLAIALACRYHEKPLYILATEDKFHPPILGPPKIEEKPPGELWDNPPHNVEVVNRYFEIVPALLLEDMETRVVTENGVYSWREIERKLDGMRVAEGLSRFWR
ncbi:MAG: hypothetical protein J7L61_02445 [Thermoplasmata archaeon]|nr:hypothetical protein [Thermoplasmata archaeon]